MIQVMDDGDCSGLVTCPSVGEVRFQTNFEREAARIC